MIQTSRWDITHKDKKGGLLWAGTSSNSRFDEGSRQVLDLYYRASAPPSGFYVRLFNSTPVKSDILGTIANEASGGGYEAAFIERSEVGWPTLAKSIPADEMGVVQAGGVDTLTLAAGASAVDGFYIDSTVSIISGTGVGQVREAVDYDGASGIVTVDRAWDVPLDGTSTYIVHSDYILTSKTVIFTATGSSIGPVTYAVLADVAVGISGKALAFFPLTQARTLSDGDSLEFSGRIKLR